MLGYRRESNKIILFADWHAAPMHDLLVQASQMAQRDYQFVKANNLEQAIVLLSEVTPDLLISQPSLLMENNYRLFNAAINLSPAPRLLVWWGNALAYEAFKDHDVYPSPVTYIELPCPLDELMGLIEDLLA